jgi:PBP1b-binding outer membrane lipoprotein LpoB
MKTKYILALFLGALFFASCGTKKEEAAATEEAVEWKELDSFHMLMAEVYHPYKDSGNVAPAKQMMEQLATESDKWAAATLPAKVNNEEVKGKLEKLKAETRNLADEIKNGATDEAIGAKLNPLHDLFHEIQEAWYKGGEEHDEHH